MANDWREFWEAFRRNPTESTFTPFYESSNRVVYTLCHRVLRNPEDAADAFQSCYCRLLALAKDENAEEDLSDEGIVCRIAMREADALKKRRNRRARREMAMERTPEGSDGRPGPDEEAANREIRAKIETLAQILPERYRLPLLLHYFDGMTQTEIAQSLGVPISTVAGRIQRGLNRLSPLMKRAGLGEALSLGALVAGAELLSPPASLSAAAVFAQASATLTAVGSGAALVGAGAGAATLAGSAQLSLGKLILGGVLMKAKIVVVSALVFLAGLALVLPKVFDFTQGGDDTSPAQVLRERPAKESPESSVPSGNQAAAIETQLLPTPPPVPSPKALPTVAKDASATTAPLSVSEEPDEKETPTVIRGKVTNRKGEPIAGAKIAAYSDLENEYLVASGEPSSSFSSVSKEDGTYEIAPCPSEPDGIVASHVDYANSIRHFETLPQVGKIEQDFVLDMGFKLRGQLTQVVDGKERAVAGQMIFICEEPAADSTLSFVRTVTDERGLFAFENCLYDRGYSVHTRVTSDIVLLNPPTIRVASGSRPQPLLLKLTEVGSLIGKVTDSAGNPVPEARVWPNRFGRAGLNNLRGRSEERDPREVITNGSGVFVLTGLALEFVYELKASAEGYPESVSGTVRAGDIPVEIVLKSPGELGVVRGKVVQGEDNAPVGGIELRLTSSGSDFIEKKTATDGDGSFEFTELADGMYYLSDPGPGLSPKEWAIQSIQSISISREQREVNLEVRALRSASIRGQVLSLETKIPVRGASLYANHPVLTPPDAPGNQQYFITGPDGAFEVSGLLPGETRLSAKKDGMLFVPRPEETSEVGAEDEKMIVNLKEGESLSDVKLYLSQGGTITGVVVNHEGSLVANCPLSLFYKETSGHSGRDFSEDYPSRISTNSDGRFRYAGLSLSRVYRILTNPSREPGNHPFASSQDIELSDSQPRAEVRIQAEEPGSIEGTVTDNDGEPVGWKKVIAMRISPEESFSMGSHVRKEQSTDQRGRYVLEGLAPGKYSLDVNGGEDYKAARVADIEVKSGEKTSGVDLTLEKVSKENRITLRGTVVDAGGARLGDCVVTLNQDTVPGSGQTRTTRSGDFALTGVAAGKECDLRFELPIGSSDGRSWRFHSGAFTPSDKEEVFILPFNGVIRGRLLHVGTKSPVDNATIHLLTPDIKVGKGWKGIECRLHWTSGNGWRISGKTDMEGRFAFPKLPIAEGYAITIESSSAATKTIKDVAIGGDLETDLGDILLDPADAYTITLTDGRTLAPYIEGNEKALSVQAKNADGTSVEIRKRAGTKPGEFILESIPRDATSLELDSQRHLPLHLDINPASPEKNLGAYVLDPGQTVRGVLQGPNGEKVEAGFVHVEFGEHSRIQNVDSTGRFKMEGLPAGPAKCNASAWRNNGVNSWIPSPGNNASLPYIDIEILPGQDTVLDLKFPPF